VNRLNQGITPAGAKPAGQTWAMMRRSRQRNRRFADFHDQLLEAMKSNSDLKANMASSFCRNTFLAEIQFVLILCPTQ
jgi:hypothetical protein